LTGSYPRKPLLSGQQFVSLFLIEIGAVINQFDRPRHQVRTVPVDPPLLFPVRTRRQEVRKEFDRLIPEKATVIRYWYGRSPRLLGPVRTRRQEVRKEFDRLIPEKATVIRYIDPPLLGSSKDKETRSPQGV
jgi:hypothetical protein